MKYKPKPEPGDEFIDFYDEDAEGWYWLYQESDGTQFVVFERKLTRS